MLEKPKNYLNLSAPIIRESGDDSNFEKVFLWQTEVGNITLTISASLKETRELGQFFLIRANLDSGNVKGQGKFLWNYLTNQLDLLARKKGKRVLHEANPNEHSDYLMANDHRYKKRSGLYYALY